MATYDLKIITAVRGYHVYQEVWNPIVGEAFICQQENGNEHDAYAVGTIRAEGGNEVIGHLPRKISRVAFFFLAHAGSISGTVTNTRRYCTQRGGMEIPCELTFSGKRKNIRKLKNYFQQKQFSCIELVSS